MTHSRCQYAKAPDRLTVLYDYHTPPIANLIIAGKYNFVPDIFTMLGELMANAITLIDKPDTIIAIPLSKKRITWRGFNQSSLLAKPIATTHNLEIGTGLQRIKHTQTQKDLPKNLRLPNMRNAFAWDSGQPIPQSVLLIDDVSTTGTTLKEGCKILKEAGARYVHCLALAQD